MQRARQPLPQVSQRITFCCGGRRSAAGKAVCVTETAERPKVSTNQGRASGASCGRRGTTAGARVSLAPRAMKLHMLRRSPLGPLVDGAPVCWILGADIFGARPNKAIVVELFDH